MLHPVATIERHIHELRTNPFKYLATEVIRLSGLFYVLGLGCLMLAAGSAANGAYGYFWSGAALMLGAIIAARLGL